MDLISKEKLDVLCIEETMLPNQTIFKLKDHNGSFKEGHTNYRAHGEVAIFNHKTIPNNNITLSTPLQSITTIINIGGDVTIVSFHNSRSNDMSEKLLSTLFQQLLKPVILSEDLK